MSADGKATEEHALQLPPTAVAPSDEKAGNGATITEPDEGGEEEEDDDDGDDDDDDEDEEPKLKYAKLTGNLSSVYRSNDSASTFTVAGDKMVMGTHNGNIHVLSLPSLQGVRNYHAHSATITSVSVSPVPPAPSTVRTESGVTQVLLSPAGPLGRTQSIQSQQSTNSPRTPRGQQEQQRQVGGVPNTPNNQVYIATSSLDGHVCISSLVDPKDVQLRNFARPVQAVALSPDYKNDKTYLSGGLAGNLILTVGGKAGVTADANTNSAAAAASGWLGSIGLGGNSGRDTVLHSGEGSISTIKWSTTGKWVVWVNEEGIKIMRSHLKLGSEESEDAWRRIAHAAKPNRKGWQDMAGVWKARAEWIDDKHLESEDLSSSGEETAAPSNGSANGNSTVNAAPPSTKRKKFEKLVVGWGDTAWILHVQHGVGYTAHSGQKQIGSADIVHKLQFRDCIVSGLSLYTPSLLAILAYRTRDDDDKPIESHDTPNKGRQRHRKTGLRPQLRLINVRDGAEVDVDELPISRFETLSAADYQLGTMYMPAPLPEKGTAQQQRGALEAAWEAAGGGYAQRLFNSGASVMSGGSSGPDEASNSKRPSLASPSASVSASGSISRAPIRRPADAHPFVVEAGLKLFIQSPYDCVLAVKRDRADHLEWLLEHEQYAQAWTLIDEHPDVIDPASSAADRSQQQYIGGGAASSQPVTPSRSAPNQMMGGAGSLADFFAGSMAEDSDSQTTAGSASRTPQQQQQQQTSSAAAKEKRRVGDLWLQQLVAAAHWAEAGPVAGKVLGTSARWEHWVWTFAQADKFDEITPYIPSARLRPPLPSLVYEVVLGHYITVDRLRLRELLELWDPLELFDARSVITAIEAKLQLASSNSKKQPGEVSEESVEGGERGRDWRILMEALAKLYLADGRGREALRCWIRCQNADKAFEMLREEKLMDAVADDVPGLLMLRVRREQLMKPAGTTPLGELEEASSEAVQLLVEEAHRGTVTPALVIRQLERKGAPFQHFLYLYLRALWHGPPQDKDEVVPRRKVAMRVDEGHALVEDHADLAVSLFAAYDDRALLLTFLRASSVYSYEKAAAICEAKHYIPELVYILSKTGQTKRALHLIIGELGDVSQAIAFAKANGELWGDLLDYSMDRPRFIVGLLEEVGMAIPPGQIVRRIPEGLEIAGLKAGIQALVREYEVQFSISEGVARVLRGEVGMGMDTLRAGRKKAVRFEVVRHEDEGLEDGGVEIAVRDVPTRVPDGQEVLPVGKRKAEAVEAKAVEPGHCVGCGDPFSDDEKETLIGFACGHVYHLSCLLRANPATADEATVERLRDQLGRGDGDDADGEATYTGRSVGAKVAHAHVIKNVVQGGCRHCVIPDGA
ncbi:hypothetical protein LTR36_007658 [Oleoguttula mirabilis]|uniref:Vps41 beta-propeller domain-containing protein n=1 Tax=Oleoguttula mirabilis TaxID=1507867 RepID=A0AAV9JUD5_9PEZI|nr:hypothetical protein LTR36_007658 [Oleoguttula mirabilis]